MRQALSPLMASGQDADWQRKGLLDTAYQ